MLSSMRALAVLLLSFAAIAAESPPSAPEPAPAPTATAMPPAAGDPPKAIPPSPSTVPGVRIWPDPAITHWPAVAYPDETRNVAFALPVRTPGAEGAIGWAGQPPLPFTLPRDLERISGLLPLPVAAGDYRAELTIGGAKSAVKMALRVVLAGDPWPQTALREGFPVDAQGASVVLLDHRRDANQERKWALLNSLQRPRPVGKAVVVGDTLAAMGASAFDGLDARIRTAVDDRQPTHAQLVGLALDMAEWSDRPPRTILWSPGNRALLNNTWTPEEERFLGVVRTRCEALGIWPRLVLVLPPAPIDDREPVRKLAAERRDQLRRGAANQGWVVLDVERLAGPAEESYRIADRVFAEGPVGEPRERLNAALRAELAK